MLWFSRGNMCREQVIFCKFNRAEKRFDWKTSNSMVPAFKMLQSSFFVILIIFFIRFNPLLLDVNKLIKISPTFSRGLNSMQIQNSAVIHIQPLLGSRSLIAVHFLFVSCTFLPTAARNAVERAQASITGVLFWSSILQLYREDLQVLP